jgi:hypothetical protein
LIAIGRSGVRRRDGWRARRIGERDMMNYGGSTDVAEIPIWD